MAFKRQSVRAWAREWRESDWRETVPLSSGRECPRPGCKATICGGKAWRDHWAGHDRQDEERRARAEWEEWAVRTIYELCEKAGIDLEPHPSGTEFYLDGMARPKVTDGYVVGVGELPEELRGGSE